MADPGRCHSTLGFAHESFVPPNRSTLPMLLQSASSQSAIAAAVHRVVGDPAYYPAGGPVGSESHQASRATHAWKSVNQYPMMLELLALPPTRLCLMLVVPQLWPERKWRHLKNSKRKGNGTVRFCRSSCQLD